MRIETAQNIADLRRMAKRRLPRMLFEVIESGVEDEHGLARNICEFQRYKLLPRYLVDVAGRDQRTALFDRCYDAPFGIAPLGFAGLMRRGAEMMLARAASKQNIPFILSGASIAPVETVGAISRQHTWFHLYAARDAAISRDALRRARDAGIETAVLTVDNPVLPNRERDRRAGFSVPFRLRTGAAFDALLHLSWLIEYLRHGGFPRMESWARYAPAGASATDVVDFFRSQSPSIQTWRELDEFRSIWPGKLLLKGIQHPEDAARSESAGIDGVIVSNHGGKSFDPLPSPLATLPAVKAAVGGRIAVMLDSGIRRGSDILVACALGADFTFVGRAALYGVVAGGERGALRAIEMLKREVDLGLALVGSQSCRDLSTAFLLAD